MTALAPRIQRHARFVWEGLDPHGARLTGAVRAADADAVRAALQGRGYTAVQVAAIDGQRRRAPPMHWARPPGTSLRRRQLAAFTAQLATLLRAGVALSPALALLAEGGATRRTDGRFASAVAAVRRDIEAGLSLAQALGRQPLWFDALCCAMVDAGEQGGILQDTLGQLARYQERTLALQRQVRAALTYPLAVLAVAAAVLMLLLLVVVPAFEDVFAGFGTELPAATRLVIALSEGLPSSLPWLVPLFALLLAAWRLALRRYPSLQRWQDAVRLRLPLLGPALCSAATARWARTLATLALAGTPLVEAMAPAARACGNLAWADDCAAIEHGARAGQGMADAMRRTARFDRMSLQLVRVGEESGTLEAMLMRIAEEHERRVEAAVAALSRLLEPLLVMVLGALIGALVIAMYLPVFSLGQAL
ncbi:type II secretion system F family protein [Cupriavidus sp. AU9028]|uniref:type II secretion system F family protein n=1 Tax=Cupriavidus sp. AU9028 TaxID=2871157 RepID=UPI001C93A2ED|nr:type II secretion system F family protein [Cupriavidus sp. AU9028]MBY4897439.1 type II secretion system F family protein [Cupriavidus sp. AU9028]